MTLRLYSVAKTVLPQNVVHTLRFLFLNLPRLLERRSTQRIFAATTDAPSYLDIGALETLQKKYPPPPEYNYDSHSLEVRGKERARQILRLPGAKEAHSFLELGCMDGMVSCCLHRKGKNTTAIDKRDAGFDERATREGVSLFQMDAADLRFQDESFDFVFSYDAFEHFTSPDRALGEAIRVVKTGGYIYLEFGPLYCSAYGEHAYRSITVPYCQFLFPRELINEFATQRGLDLIDFSHVNGWSLERFRELWGAYSQVLDRVRYYESLDLAHLDLIRSYPACFKSKTSYFDNLLVATVSVLFRKVN